MKVISFVDKCKMGINIIKPRELECISNKDDVCIYICMQNAMQHEGVADMLYKMGFKHIVFLPVSNKYNLQAYKMLELWNDIFYNGIHSEFKVPHYDSFLIQTIPASHIIHVPMELIFTNMKCADQQKKYRKKHISLLEPYNQLYRYIYDDGETPLGYLKYNHNLKGNGKVQQILKDRIDLYEALSNRISNDSLYYSMMACQAKIDQLGRFVLEDGNHRANLAFHLGKDFLPIIVPKGEIDYEWLNDFMRERNYKLFLLLTDIVLSLPEKVSYSIYSVDNVSLISKYMNLLLDKSVNIFITDNMRYMKNADLKIVFKHDLEKDLGRIYIFSSNKDLKHVKQYYVIDNRVYRICINEGNSNDFT